MSDEYLWDKSGAPDREVAEMEALLSRYRLRAGAAPAPARTSARLPLLAAAAAVAALFLIVARFASIESDGYRVFGVEGREVVHAGEELSTGSLERASLRIGWLGHVEIAPNSRVRVEDCGDVSHRLYLARGSISAKIYADPRRFRIGTPAGSTIDLGCAYALDVDADGRAELRVTDGQVAFEFDGREVYVPKGARCMSIPGHGPSAPVFDDSSDAFKAAVAELELGGSSDPAADERNPTMVERRLAAIERMLASAEREDTLTLWHLFDSDKIAESVRRASYERLSKTFPKPDGVTDEGLLAGDREMRTRWMESMKRAWRVQ